MNLITLDSPKKAGSFTIYDVSGAKGAECYLFVNDHLCFLVDSGFGFCSEKLYKNIQYVLDTRPLDYILLTHSHFDHCLGSGYISKMYPDCKIISGAYAGKIMAKDSAKATMRRLDKAAAESSGEEFIDYTDLLHTDILVEDQDLIDLKGTQIKVVSLPGHTRCSTAFYIVEDKFFISCETIGIMCNEILVMPSFLVGYDMTIDSINKAAGYDIDYYFIPHQGYILGNDCKEFFEKSIKSHIMGRDLILECYDKGLSTEETIKAFEDVYYTDFIKDKYPYSSFLENINIQIPLIIREFRGQ